MNASPWLTPADVAKAAGTSDRRVQQWCEEGQVRAIRIRSLWRISGESVGMDAPFLPARGSFRVAEVARWLRISRKTVYRLITAQDLETIEVRNQQRIPRAAVELFIERAWGEEPT